MSREIVARLPLTKYKHSRIDLAVYKINGKLVFKFEVIIDDLDTKDECKKWVREKENGKYCFEFDFEPNKLILDALKRELGYLFDA